MSRIRRTLAVSVTVLLVAGVFASPVFAQTEVESEAPYPDPEDPDDPEDPEDPEDPQDPEGPEDPDDPDAPDDDTDVGGIVEDDDDAVDAAPETETGTPAPETTSVLGITLQRTGVNALLLGALGLLVLGLGGFLVLRTRRSAPEA